GVTSPTRCSNTLSQNIEVPLPTQVRTCSSVTKGNCNTFRLIFMARYRSCAESTKVPSRSNKISLRCSNCAIDIPTLLYIIRSHTKGMRSACLDCNQSSAHLNITQAILAKIINTITEIKPTDTFFWVSFSCATRDTGCSTGIGVGSGFTAARSTPSG